MRKEDKHYVLVLEAAHDHFKEHGDKVRAKTAHDPHSSYDVLRGYLTRYAYGRLGRSWQDAEDAVQDAYVHVLETAKVNELFNFAGLYKIWLDRSIRDIRIAHKKEYEVIVEDEVCNEAEGLTIIDLAESDDAPTDLLMEVQERVNELIDRTNTLKPKAKDIIRLTVLFGYSYKEVASMLGVDIKRVENTLRYFRGLYSEKEKL